MRLAGLAALLLALAAGASAQPCPISYNTNHNLLMGGVLNNGVQCTTASGQPCQRAAGYWAEECKFPTSSDGFGVCNEEQRAAGLKIAEQLHGGDAMRTTPCDLFPYIRGRTLWLIGDSHTKQLFKSMNCFMYDFWDGKDCKVSDDEALHAQLNALPRMNGEVRCLHLMGDTRICRVHAVLGTTLVNNPALPEGGVLNLLRNKLADPNDIFVMQFGLWHLLEGPPGLEKFKTAVQQLGEDYQRNKDRFPFMIFRDTPMRHDKDSVNQKCNPAPAYGWGLDYNTGHLFISSSNRTEFTANMTRGGALNSNAREILGRYGMPYMGGFDYSVPLHVQHPAMRGTDGSLDCIHFCHFGLPELLVHEMGTMFKRNAAGIQPLPEVPAEKRRPCNPLVGVM